MSRREMRSPGNRACEAIIRGTPVTNDTLGAALLMNCPNGQAGCNYSTGAAWGCSGTMVADRWFLTARHCVQTNDSATVLGTPIPAADALVYEPYGATWAVGQAIFQHPTLDVALVFLTSSIENAAGQAYWTRLYAGTSAGLVGTRASTARATASTWPATAAPTGRSAAR